MALTKVMVKVEESERYSGEKLMGKILKTQLEMVKGNLMMVMMRLANKTVIIMVEKADDLLLLMRVKVMALDDPIHWPFWHLMGLEQPVPAAASGKLHI